MATWKDAERTIAKRLGLRRTGQYGGADCEGAYLAVEVKHRGRLPKWLHDAMAQAESHTGPAQLPMVVLHEHRQPYSKAFIVLRLQDFQDWYGGGRGCDG